MKISKSVLCRVGDKVKFQENVPIKEGRNYHHGKIYDGIIKEHIIDNVTTIEIVGDDGNPVMVKVFYDSFSSGMNSFEIEISDEEFKKRKIDWLANAISKVTIEYNKRVEYLKSIEFQ